MLIQAVNSSKLKHLLYFLYHQDMHQQSNILDLLDLLWVYEFQLDDLSGLLLRWLIQLCLHAGKQLSFALSVDDSVDAALSTIYWAALNLAQRTNGSGQASVEVFLVEVADYGV